MRKGEPASEKTKLECVKQYVKLAHFYHYLLGFVFLRTAFFSRLFFTFDYVKQSVKLTCIFILTHRR